ncbi:hypothetical protein PIB30_074645 [Stylosanthes scabra]|uniref:Uncharacterized protein n=1 Tax=Stylosanthes scabra TaxID=79078 RepID=A0ABU6ZNC5_9FABA|nr:hypothetical protein [Stylosanthes scabra]
MNIRHRPCNYQRSHGCGNVEDVFEKVNDLNPELDTRHKSTTMFPSPTAAADRADLESKLLRRFGEE